MNYVVLFAWLAVFLMFIFVLAFKNTPYIGWFVAMLLAGGLATLAYYLLKLLLPTWSIP